MLASASKILNAHEITSQEIYKTLEKQLKKRDETGVDAKQGDASGEARAKGRAQRGGKGRRDGGKSAEKMRDAPKQDEVKSTRRKRTDNQTEPDPAAVTATAEAKARSEAATGTATSRGSRKKVEERESASGPSRAARAGRRPPVASQPDDRHGIKHKDAQSASHQAAPARSRRKAVAAEAAEDAVLRRSKRIASRIT